MGSRVRPEIIVFLFVAGSYYVIYGVVASRLLFFRRVANYSRTDFWEFHWRCHALFSKG